MSRDVDPFRGLGAQGACPRCGILIFHSTWHTEHDCARRLRRRRRKVISAGKKARVMERDGRRCRLCSSTDRLEIDHVIPVVHGGTNEESNLQVLCWKCNNGKGARMPANRD